MAEQKKPLYNILTNEIEKNNTLKVIAKPLGTRAARARKSLKNAGKMPAYPAKPEVLQLPQICNFFPGNLRKPQNQGLPACRQTGDRDKSGVYYR